MIEGAAREIPLPAAPAGDIWGVTSYFNPTSNPWLPRNLALFADGVRVQGLKLAIVELAQDGASFEVDSAQCDLLIQRRCDVTLWQKERLLNIAIEALPEACSKVVWLDCDLLFENDDWVVETARLLDTHAIVQPFDSAVWLSPGTLEPPEQPVSGLGEGCAMPGMAVTMAAAPVREHRRLLADYYNHGHPGFAWAARRELLTRHGLYDRHVLGGGDVTIAHAIYGDRDYLRGLNMACRDMTAAEIEGSIAHVPGRVRHLWHGALAQRGYRDRWKILKQAGFDPRRDVSIDPDHGCLRWASDKPALHAEVAGYFRARNAPAPVAA